MNWERVTPGEVDANGAAWVSACKRLRAFYPEREESFIYNVKRALETVRLTSLDNYVMGFVYTRPPEEKKGRPWSPRLYPSDKAWCTCFLAQRAYARYKKMVDCTHIAASRLLVYFWEEYEKETVGAIKCEVCNCQFDAGVEKLMHKKILHVSPVIGLE